MQGDHPAARMTADDESRALSLHFRQEVYEMTVKAQRELITAGIRAAGRCYVEIVLVAISVNRTTEHPSHRPRTKRAYAANAA